MRQIAEITYGHVNKAFYFNADPVFFITQFVNISMSGISKVITCNSCIYVLFNLCTIYVIILQNYICIINRILCFIIPMVNAVAHIKCACMSQHHMKVASVW